MPGWFGRTRARAKELFREYGSIWVGTMMTLWLTEWAAWSSALYLGLPIDGLLADWGVVVTEDYRFWGVITAGWAATQVLTKAPRLALSIYLTPLVARPIRRMRTAR